MELIAELAGAPREVGRARRLLRPVLRGWGVVGEPAEIVLLLTSELLTNAIRHGSPPVVLRAGIGRHGQVRVEVDDHVPGTVRARHAAPDDVDGRGLELVDVLADAWGTRRAGSGKQVWFELHDL